MLYSSIYESPIGNISIITDDYYLIGLYFDNQKYYHYKINEELTLKENIIIKDTIIWLNAYFNKTKQLINIKLNPIGTPYQKRVFKLLQSINYGEVKTYKEIKELYEKTYNLKTSARAIGNAISKNPISIIIPCHRVIGTNNQLTGYAGGLERKKWLLDFESN